MKSTLKDLPRAVIQGFVECLLYFPVLLIPMVYLLPNSLINIWPLIVVLGYGAGFAGSRALKLNTFLKSVLWASVIALLISFFLGGTSLALLITVPSLFVACYRGSRMEHMSWSQMFPGSYFIIGFIIYGVSSFVLSFIESFQPYTTALTVSGAAALIVTLFIVNRNSVEEQTLSGSERPFIEQRVLRQNRGLIIVLLLIISILVFLPQLQQWLSELGRSIAAWIAGFLTTTPGELEPVQNLPQETSLPFNDEKSTPPAWIKFIEKLTFYAVYIAAAALIVYLLYRFVKILPRLLRKASKWLNRLMSRQTQVGAALGYEDEEVEIEHEKAAGRLKRLLSKVQWNGSRHAEPDDNSAKIRRIYKKVLIRKIREGYRWKPSRTPRETGLDIKEWKEADESISEDLIRLYEQARYGHKPITDDELKDNIQELKHK